MFGWPAKEQTEVKFKITVPYLTWEMSAGTKDLNIKELNYFSSNKLRVNLHSNRIGNESCWQNLSKENIPKDDLHITLENQCESRNYWRKNKQLASTEIPQTYIRLTNMSRKGFGSSYPKIPREEIKSQKRHILKTLANWLFAHSECKTMQAILYRILLTL